MRQEDFTMSAFSGVKVRPSLKSINCLARWVWLAIAIFFLLWFTFSLHFVKNHCPVIIFSILSSSLFPYPFIPSLFLILFSVSSVFSGAKISNRYINEMQPSVFLPVYFSYNHRTLYRTTSERIEATFHFFLQPSKLVMAYLDYPLCKTQTLSCKAKVMPIVK